MLTIRLFVICCLFSTNVMAHGESLHIHWYESEILGLSLIMIAVLLGSAQFISFINSKYTRSTGKNSKKLDKQGDTL